jgi:hypothetical protein
VVAVVEPLYMTVRLELWISTPRRMVDRVVAETLSTMAQMESLPSDLMVEMAEVSIRVAVEAVQVPLVLTLLLQLAVLVALEFLIHTLAQQ